MAAQERATPPIKYETSSNNAPSLADLPTKTSQSPTLKRDLPSEQHEQPEDGDAKRQKITSAFAPPQQYAPSFDIADLLATATANTTQQISSASAALNGDVGVGNGNGSASLGNQSDARDARHGSGFANDPYLYMRVLSLPILESLSTQILSTLAQGPYNETIEIVTNPRSELGQAYKTLKSLFEQTKKIYSQSIPFLSADELNIREPAHRETLRTTNLATFVSSVFGGQDVGFYSLNDHFIETFAAYGQDFGEDAGQLFINLKTQMYLSHASQEEQERSKEDILGLLFPDSFETTLLARHPHRPLSINERRLVAAARERRNMLFDSPQDAETIQALSEQYSWEEFLRRLGTHLITDYEPLLAPYMRRHALTAPATPKQTPLYQSRSALKSIESDPATDMMLRKAVQETLQGLKTKQTQPIKQEQPSPRARSASRVTPQSRDPSNDLAASVEADQPDQPDQPFPDLQTAPTQILYENARQVAAAKSNPGATRRPGLPSQRRPWSTEEENTLMAGLDKAKGPHWSSILAMYGPKGSVNQVLKDRNQVQLKDKARNLKLFFLKSNIEVPYYLTTVTGDLRSRAPTTAARIEAEVRARADNDEEQARIDGLFMLSNGMKARNAERSLSSPAVSPSPPPQEEDDTLFVEETMMEAANESARDLSPTTVKMGTQRSSETVRQAFVSASSASGAQSSEYGAVAT